MALKAFQRAIETLQASMEYKNALLRALKRTMSSYQSSFVCEERLKNGKKRKKSTKFHSRLNQTSGRSYESSSCPPTMRVLKLLKPSKEAYFRLRAYFF